jgi:predicted  nucleic acid-binding Zn-ribbon protein
MRQLILLRDIDEEIAGVGSGLARIPEERETIERELVAARETLAQAKQLLEDQEAEERRLEGRMREQEALLKRLNAQSVQVTSSQAYEALQHELDNAGRASSEFETRALELMEAIDQVRGEVAAAESRLQEAEERSPAQLDEISRREGQLTAERETLLERREKARGAADGRARDAARATREGLPAPRRPASRSLRAGCAEASSGRRHLRGKGLPRMSDRAPDDAGQRDSARREGARVQ